MQLSKYIYTYIKNDENLVYIYSNKSKEIVKLSAKLYSRLKEMKLDLIDTRIIDTLIQKEILVEDDSKLVDEYLSEIRNSRDTLFLKVMTTEACNLKCVYCYQGQDKKNSYLTELIEDDLVKWAKKQIDSFGYKNISISFYGGEPLLNKTSMFRLMNKFNQMKEMYVNTEYSLVTNGILLDILIFEELVKNGLVKYSVSIDGYIDINDIRRPDKSGNGTYNKILTNLKNIHDKFPSIELSISTVLDKQNYNEYYKFLDDLKRNNIISNVIINCVPCKISVHSNEHFDKYSNVDQNIDDRVKLLKKVALDAKRRGITQKNAIGIPDGICKFSRNNYFVIDTLGYIYPCASVIGMEECIIGNVSDADNKTIYPFSYIKGKAYEDNECINCNFYPACAGGCRFEAYVETGSWDVKKCEKQYLNRLAEELLPVYLDKNEQEDKHEKTY
ncbi:MAG: radical SAM protein [Lutisporaceae bacterium]